MIENLPQSIDEFLTLCEECQVTQEAVLFDILSSAKESEIGKKFDFARIKSIETFRKQIKPTGWSDVEPYSQRLQKGEENLLFSENIPFFICTSGTTGNMKIIPESKNGIKIKSLTTKIRVDAIAKYTPLIREGKMFPLVNHAVEGYTEANIPYGSASGITLQSAPKSLQEKISFPMELLEIDYAHDSDYFIMRFAICEDVRITYGNNAGRLIQLFNTVNSKSDQFIEDIENGTLHGIETLPSEIQEKLQKLLKPNPKYATYLRKEKQRYGEFFPRSYWTNLQSVTAWLSGSVGRYAEDLYEFLEDDVMLFDLGYGATEGKFNIPIKPNHKDGVLSIYGIFYEFKDLKDNLFYLAHELKSNTSYELYITTYSGLYRYAIGDIIFVSGFTGTTPNIYFEQKSGEVLNICGEKISASSLIPVIDQAVMEITQYKPYHWCVIPDEDQKCYHFCIELSSKAQNMEKIEELLAQKIEELLQKDTLIYPIFRKQNLIEKSKLTLMQQGWQKALYDDLLRAGHSSTQAKLPLLYNHIPLETLAL